MTPNKACIDFIKSREGLSLVAYQDSVGIWTIGYGTIRYENGAPVKKGDVVGQQRAEELITKDILLRSVFVNNLTAAVTLNQNQFNALLSFAYNAGKDALRKSMLLTLVRANPVDPAIRGQFMVWDKAHRAGKLVTLKGLSIRRQAEADLYFLPIHKF